MIRFSIKNQSLSCYVRLMRQEDIAQVTNIDRLVFPTMKPVINFHNELQNKLAHYVVVCSKDKVVDEPRGGGSETSVLMLWLGSIFGWRNHPQKEADKLKQYIFGFAGLWMMADEAHIINIAVLEEYRRKGIGELLVIAMVDMAIAMKARFIVLEVRVSNIIAQGLYAKYGFKAVGVRHAYYTDNREDAVMMTTGDVTSDEFQMNLKRLKEIHSERWGVDSYEIER